jgi:hypothetical protein
MCVISYLASKRAAVRMPVCPQGMDASGIKWSGEVLQGGLSVGDALTMDWAAAGDSRDLPEDPLGPLE